MNEYTRVFANPTRARMLTDLNVVSEKPRLSGYTAARKRTRDYPAAAAYNSGARTLRYACLVALAWEWAMLTSLVLVDAYASALDARIVAIVGSAGGRGGDAEALRALGRVIARRVITLRVMALFVLVSLDVARSAVIITVHVLRPQLFGLADTGCAGVVGWHGVMRLLLVALPRHLDVALRLAMAIAVAIGLLFVVYTVAMRDLRATLCVDENGQSRSGTQAHKRRRANSADELDRA
jgi:hypothetical protein